MTTKDVGSSGGGNTSFGSYPKEEYKSELQSPDEPHKEEEDNATPLGCKEENLVEEKATLVSLREDGKVKNMDNKISYFCGIHVHLKPYYPWKYKSIHLHLRTAKGRPLHVREINSLPISLLVITQSVKRRVILLMVIIW